MKAVNHIFEQASLVPRRIALSKYEGTQLLRATRIGIAKDTPIENADQIFAIAPGETIANLLIDPNLKTSNIDDNQTIHMGGPVVSEPLFHDFS